MSAETPDKPVGRPPLSREKEVLNLIVPKELMTRLRTVAQERDATIASFVRRAIEERLDRIEREGRLT